LVYGTAGNEGLLNFENTDRSGNAWQTGGELRHTVQTSSKWEIMEFNFVGAPVGWDYTGNIHTTGITSDSCFNHDLNNGGRIMYKLGDNGNTFVFYMDDLGGRHVED
jgi:hypothetical protein